jgi:hypothetical protein
MIARPLRNAASAPLAVLVLGWLVGRTPVAPDLWWLLHVMGGVALAFFFLRVFKGNARYAAAFAFACTGALAWEAIEFALDELFATKLQEGLVDTMTDLLFGACGAAGYLAFAALPRRER